MSDVSAPEETRTRLGWLLYNLRQSIGGYLRRHKKAVIAICVVLIYGIFMARSWWQPGVVWIRVHIFPLLMLGLFGYFLISRGLQARAFRRAGWGLVLSAMVAGVWFTPIFDYLALYVRYQSLPKVELTELMVTANERIHPLNSIYSRAFKKMGDTEQPQRPDFVRFGEGDFRWTMAVEPAHFGRQVVAPVREVYCIPATTPTASFAHDNRIDVTFDVGEGLRFGRNSYVATQRSFGLWRFVSYEPASVAYLRDDDGRVVQVVSLIKWSGLFFPRPEFGGVQLIEQNADGFSDYLKRTYVGSGTWIKPEDIERYPFLTKQNLIPERVTRYWAESFRFQNGFRAPLPGYHKGDIRIPDLPADVNDQPFTVWFENADSLRSEGRLYDYFALEPYKADKQGLATSVYIPADGQLPVYFYRHHERQGDIAGVSAIAGMVEESKKNYDWRTNRAVEHRPWVKIIDGETRFFWLTTVVTIIPHEEAGSDSAGTVSKEKGEEQKHFQQFIAGSTPELAMTEAASDDVTWVDVMKPGSWETVLREKYRTLW